MKIGIDARMYRKDTGGIDKISNVKFPMSNICVSCVEVK